MGTQINLASISGVDFIILSSTKKIPLQSLIGDWENGRWGDGKFPGLAAVSTIALLKYQAKSTSVSELSKVFGEAAENLTSLLEKEIVSFQNALDRTPQPFPW
jgi:hypothetical protein